MAWTAKFTAKMGQLNKADVAIAAGSSEAQSDTISINMDVTNAGKREIADMIDAARDAFLATTFPVN